MDWKTTVPIAVLLAGCAAPAVVPDDLNEQALREADAIWRTLPEFPLPVLRRYCMSAYWAGRGDKLDACLAESASRRPWLASNGAERHARDLQAREHHLRALRALDAADYSQAIARAAELRDMRRDKNGYKYEAVDALGVLAVASALAGDSSSCEKYLNELEAVGLGPFSGLYYERIWIARAYMALGNYAQAYEHARRLSFGIDSLVERTASTYAPTGEADGYLFILAKSGLETGHREEARSRFEKLLAEKSLRLGASKTGRPVTRADLERDFAQLAR